MLFASKSSVDASGKRQIEASCDFEASSPTSKCQTLMNQMHTAVGHVNLYNVYGDCISGHAAQPSSHSTGGK